MEIISGPRGSGRTTQLICRSYKEKIPIIEPTAYMAHYVKGLAQEMGFVDIPDPVSINKVVSQGRSVKRYLIDNLEMVLWQLGIECVCATTTTCEEEEQNG